MKTQQNLKTEILALAKSHLQRTGFGGFSFQTLADQVGIRKSSLHYYFKSKEVLGLELIQEYEQAFEKWTLAVASKNAMEKLDGMFQIFVLMAKDGKKICPTGALSIEFQNLPRSMQKRLLQFHEKQKQWLVSTIHEGQNDGLLSIKLSAHEYADLLLSIFQGSIQISRLEDDVQLMIRTYQALKKIMVEEGSKSFAI